MFCPGDGAWGGCAAAGGRVCVMGTALGTMPSTGGGRPPAGRFTTPGGYLDGRETDEFNFTKNTTISIF